MIWRCFSFADLDYRRARPDFPHASGHDPPELPEYSDSSEHAYCQRVAAAHSDTYALMDGKTIPIGGGYNKIEFCDLYTPDQNLIHIKRYAASSVLSHLFSQGVVSGESFRMDGSFRKAVNDLLPVSYKLSEPAKAPDTSAYRIIFAVISDQPSRSLTLPFFSRVNLKHAAMRLQGYGYNVALAKIDVAKSVTTLKKYKSTLLINRQRRVRMKLSGSSPLSDRETWGARARMRVLFPMYRVATISFRRPPLRRTDQFVTALQMHCSHQHFA